MKKKDVFIPDSSYSTGDTCPGKSRSGLLVCLLAGVILLGSAISLLGFLNIETGEASEPAVVFSQQASATEAHHIGNATPMLGIRCETVSPFMHNYYHLPNGVYVTQLLDNGAAQTAGLQAGDVITALNGEPVFTAQALLGAVRSCQVGDRVWLTVARNGQIHSVSLILKSEEP